MQGVAGGLGVLHSPHSIQVIFGSHVPEEGPTGRRPRQSKNGAAAFTDERSAAPVASKNHFRKAAE
jgi:hypothetical protein